MAPEGKKFLKIIMKFLVGANLLKMCEYDHSADMWSIGCVIYQCDKGSVKLI